jgi:hypothetical protein
MQRAARLRQRPLVSAKPLVSAAWRVSRRQLVLQPNPMVSRPTSREAPTSEVFWLVVLEVKLSGKNGLSRRMTASVRANAAEHTVPAGALTVTRSARR